MRPSIDDLEKSISNLDVQQGRAVIETVNGVQRIRGLAGSGKTIVLALKAAYLHSQHPEWTIAVTFFSSSLKDQFKRLINSFYIDQTKSEPDWNKILILHAWGSNSQNPGIYYNYCLDQGAEYFNYNNAKDKFGSDLAFSLACQTAIETTVEVKEAYDVILIDEAQDLPQSFFRLCYKSLREPKRLVYAYDELQNLNAQPLPSPEELFGLNDSSLPNVKFVYNENTGMSKQDIILKKCYRNSRPVLVTAHALGFGVYKPENPKTGTGLVQMFQRKNLWNEVGYQVESGQLANGKQVVLGRNDEFSQNS